jgi:hypothetical protein
MEHESCGVCGGDGRISNAFGGSSTSCPACRGSGRRSTGGSLFRDVTKTKPSHHSPATKAAAVVTTWPSTPGGTSLATEIKDSALPDLDKTRLVREIIEYEGTHGSCTQTFTRKIRKQFRPAL